MNDLVRSRRVREGFKMESEIEPMKRFMPTFLLLWSYGPVLAVWIWGEG